MHSYISLLFTVCSILLYGSFVEMPGKIVVCKEKWYNTYGTEGAQYSQYRSFNKVENNKDPIVLHFCASKEVSK
jgi:hypothetical protein